MKQITLLFPKCFFFFFRKNSVNASPFACDRALKDFGYKYWNRSLSKQLLINEFVEQTSGFSLFLFVCFIVKDEKPPSRSSPAGFFFFEGGVLVLIGQNRCPRTCWERAVDSAGGVGRMLKMTLRKGQLTVASPGGRVPPLPTRDNIDFI